MDKVRAQVCQGALTGKQALWGGSAPERGHAAPLEHLTQLCDAFGGVGAVTPLVEAAELVAAQAAKGREECQWR